MSQDPGHFPEPGKCKSLDGKVNCVKQRALRANREHGQADQTSGRLAQDVPPRRGGEVSGAPNFSNTLPQRGGSSLLSSAAGAQQEVHNHYRSGTVWN